MSRDTIPCGPPDGCTDPREPAQNDFVARFLSLPPGLGARRETTTQRDSRERGLRRFNAFGCK